VSEQRRDNWSRDQVRSLRRKLRNVKDELRRAAESKRSWALNAGMSHGAARRLGLEASAYRTQVYTEKMAFLRTLAAASARLEAVTAALVSLRIAEGLCPRCGCCSGFPQKNGSTVCIGRCEIPGDHHDPIDIEQANEMVEIARAILTAGQTAPAADGFDVEIEITEVRKGKFVPRESDFVPPAADHAREG
jgi:hypothetical protein